MTGHTIIIRFHLKKQHVGFQMRRQAKKWHVFWLFVVMILSIF